MGQNTVRTLRVLETMKDTWLMHHAQECSVIEPESVREEMRKRLEIMLGNYS